MDSRIEANMEFLTNLFAGPFPGHGIVMTPPMTEKPTEGDYIVSDAPLEKWVDWTVSNYESMLGWSENFQDDAVPYVRGCSGTEFFAMASGCEAHVHEGSPPSARPLVNTAEEADRLPEPALTHPIFQRYWSYVDKIRERVGPDVPISVPDIQSPLDIAALIWNKEDFFVAMHEEPDAVLRLIEKCHRLLSSFLLEFKKRLPNGNMCHCPIAWAPARLGCWLSEDEVGSISTAGFQQFCEPFLRDLSETFGGIFIHCCASAPHQYDNFARLPGLRGMNRVFTEGTFQTAIDAFAGKATLIQAWYNEQQINEMLDMARPDSRFLFNVPNAPVEESRAIYDRLRARCPRH